MLTKNRFTGILGATLSGLLLYGALSPHDHWLLAWFALVPLLCSLSGATVRRAALLGGVTGTVVNFFAFHWCIELMETFSNLGPGSYLIMLLMAVYQAVPWALWCAFLRAPGPQVENPRRRRIGFAVFSVSLFVALEYFYPIIFPWYLANTQHMRPELLSIIEVGGVSSLSMVMLIVNFCLARALVGEPQEVPNRLWPIQSEKPLVWRWLLPVPIILVALLAWDGLRVPQVERQLQGSPRLELGLVQPKEWIRSGPSIEGLHKYQVLTHQLVEKAAASGRPLDLILWPESAVRTPPGLIERAPKELNGQTVLEPPGRLTQYPIDVTRLVPSFTVPNESLELERGASTEDLLAIQRGHSVPILFGTSLVDLDPNAEAPIPGRAPLYNCGILIDENGEVLGAVKKVKLLLFGETIPGSAHFPWIYSVLPAASALLPGTDPEVISFRGSRLGIMICYEDLLPWFHYTLAKKDPQILLNLTNDAWFGRTAEPGAHLALSKLRAVEGRCYLVRSTPTGISAVVDSFGKMVGEIPSGQSGTLQRTVVLSDVKTGFERWGDTIAWLSLLFSLVYGVFWWTSRARAAKLADPQSSV